MRVLAHQSELAFKTALNYPQPLIGLKTEQVSSSQAVRALTRSVENAEDDAETAANMVKTRVTPNDVLIGIAASGTTAFTVSAIEAASRLGALTIGVANNADTPLTALADHGITLLTGAESVAGSTRMKAGTAQKICLNLISTLVMVRMGRVQNGVMSAMRPANAKLRDRQKRIDAFLKRD